MKAQNNLKIVVDKYLYVPLTGINEPKNAWGKGQHGGEIISDLH